MQYIPLPKQVCNKIEVICWFFLCSSKEVITRKSPISWNKVFSPKFHGDLNIISVKLWNKACLIKLLWNLSGNFMDKIGMLLMHKENYNRDGPHKDHMLMDS